MTNQAAALPGLRAFAVREKIGCDDVRGFVAMQRQPHHYLSLMGRFNAL
jgi:hypothetical protein